MLKTLVLGGFVILVAFIVENVHSVHLNEEFSVGTSLNKYLWSPKDSADDDSTTKGQKRTAPVWFLRTGKRSQTAEGDNLPPEILEILEKVQKSPELQNILLEKLNLEGLLPLIVYLPNNQF
ncbi:CLUMA_CG005970, isoform A [Clunio marinus]|uniref:CLUMA_CG005970, isoform A n=1 Tax=Clunio marinus TaxID=568069 RepID=A0A1J1HWL1_9DIPT|nr:CLUMA_CG005970, isoform A [Clunio marinus]